jgi:DNA-binding NarL/FixJ family response regulator
MRVLIAEDDTLLREGLLLLLSQEGIDVVGAFDNADDLLAQLEPTQPDIVILDVRLPPTFTNEGLRAAVEARRRMPTQPILVLSAYVDDSYASDLLADGAGGIGYLLKERVGKVGKFLDALTQVASGGTVMDADVISQLMVRRHSEDPINKLTPREREVLALMAEGHSNGTIAQQLFVSETAVSKHVRNIFAKLGLAPEDAGHRRVLAVLAHLRS